MNQFSSSWPIQRSDQIKWGGKWCERFARRLRCLFFLFFFVFSLSTTDDAILRWCYTTRVRVYFFSFCSFFLFFRHLCMSFVSFCFDYPDASDWTEDVRRSRDIYYTKKYMVLCNLSPPSLLFSTDVSEREQSTVDLFTFF